MIHKVLDRVDSRDIHNTDARGPGPRLKIGCVSRPVLLGVNVSGELGVSHVTKALMGIETLSMHSQLG